MECAPLKLRVSAQLISPNRKRPVRSLPRAVLCASVHNDFRTSRPKNRGGALQLFSRLACSAARPSLSPAPHHACAHAKVHRAHPPSARNQEGSTAAPLSSLESGVAARDVSVSRAHFAESLGRLPFASSPLESSHQIRPESAVDRPEKVARSRSVLAASKISLGIRFRYRSPQQHAGNARLHETTRVRVLWAPHHYGYHQPVGKP